MNKLHIVKKRGKFPGYELKNVEGFDYEDDKTGFSINVRDGETEVRICGFKVDIAVLHDVAVERGRKA